MEDFENSLNDHDFDWEFNAPHWYDFDKEDDLENPDSWFDQLINSNDEDDKKSLNKLKKDFSQSYTKEPHKNKHATRIPVAKGTKIKNNKSTANISSQFLKDTHKQFSRTQKDEKSLTIISSHSSKFYSKLPVRVPLKEKRTNLK